MDNWQDLKDYIDGEISGENYFRNNKPTYNNLLGLANEVLSTLEVDNISFTCTDNVTEDTSILFPRNLKTVEKVYLNGEYIERVDKIGLDKVSDLRYCLSESMLLFSQPVTFTNGNLKIYGTGSLPVATKSGIIALKFIPTEFHYLIAYFILQRLFVRARIGDLAQYYGSEYQRKFQDYEWAKVKRRTVVADFNPYQEIYEDLSDVLGSIDMDFTAGEPTYPQSVIDQKIQQAISNLQSQVYDKTTTDFKDTLNLNAAKSYTYSQEVIDAKDVIATQTANAYTDETAGVVRELLDEVSS